MLGNKAKRELKINQRRILIDSIEIGIPSPEQILSWGKRQLPSGETVGEVKNSKTVNYKRFTPLRDGLFCERIFGPVNSFICACGKRQPRTDIKFCDRCEVEYTDQRIRRSRLGLISLISPVTHLWYLKGRPSYLSLFLGKRKKKVVTLAYCNAYLVEQSFVQNSSHLPENLNGLLRSQIELENHNDGFLAFNPTETLPSIRTETRAAGTTGTRVVPAALVPVVPDFRYGKARAFAAKESKSVPKLYSYEIDTTNRHGIDWQTKSLKSNAKLKQTRNLFYNSAKSNLFSDLHIDIKPRFANAKPAYANAYADFTHVKQSKNKTDTLKPKQGINLQSISDMQKKEDLIKLSDRVRETHILENNSNTTSPPSFLHLLTEMQDIIKKDILLNYSLNNKKDSNFLPKNYISSILPSFWSYSYSKLIVRLAFDLHCKSNANRRSTEDKAPIHTGGNALLDVNQKIGLFDNYLKKELQHFDTEGKEQNTQVDLAQLDSSVNRNTNSKAPLSPSFSIKMVRSFGDQRFSTSWPFKPKNAADWADPAKNLYMDQIFEKNKAETEYALISPYFPYRRSTEGKVAPQELLDSHTDTSSDSTNESVKQQSPAFSLSAQTPQLEKNLYNRAQSLPFLPSFVCKYNLREDLLNFLHDSPRDRDQPIPIYCSITRWQPLTDALQFMSEKAVPVNNSKVLITRSHPFAGTTGTRAVAGTTLVPVPVLLPKRLTFANRRSTESILPVLNEQGTKKEYYQRYKHNTPINKKSFLSSHGKKLNKINGFRITYPFVNPDNTHNRYLSSPIRSRQNRYTISEHLASCRQILYLALLEKNCGLKEKEISERINTTSVLYIFLSRQDIIFKSSPFSSFQPLFSGSHKSKENQTFSHVPKKSAYLNKVATNQNEVTLLQPFDTSCETAPLLIGKLPRQNKAKSRAQLIKSWRVSRLVNIVGNVASLRKSITQARVRSLQYNSPEKLYRFLLLDKAWIRSIVFEKYKNPRKLVKANKDIKSVFAFDLRSKSNTNPRFALAKRDFALAKQKQKALLQTAKKEERQTPTSKTGIAYSLLYTESKQSESKFMLRCEPYLQYTMPNLPQKVGRDLIDNISASSFSRSERRLLNRVSNCDFDVSRYNTNSQLAFDGEQATDNTTFLRVPNQIDINLKLSVFLILPKTAILFDNTPTQNDPSFADRRSTESRKLPNVFRNKNSSLPLVRKRATQLEKIKLNFDTELYGLQIQKSDKNSQFFCFSNRANLLDMQYEDDESSVSNNTSKKQLLPSFTDQRSGTTGTRVVPDLRYAKALDPVRTEGKVPVESEKDIFTTSKPLQPEQEYLTSGIQSKDTNENDKDTNQNDNALSPLEFMTIREILSYTGGGALQNLLKRFDTQTLTVFLAADIKTTRFAYKEKMLKKEYPPSRLDKKILTRLGRRIYKNSRRLKIVQLLVRSCRRPEWMMISTLPVLPPDLRPILQMSENVVVASDLNNLYQRVIYRNNRFHKLSFIDFHLVTAIQRLVQDAVDRLIENGKGGSKPFYTPGGRALKSLSDVLKGKKGRFRLNLLGKRVDFSGRSVIVVSPALNIHECGLPREIALELYHYFLLRKFLLTRRASSIVVAKKMIKQREPGIWDILRDIIYQHPVLLNRAPTLHRLGIQAFQPKLVKGNAIQLHPLVCSGFNADFDGDQMGIHLPLSVQARAEAWDLLWSRNNLLSPATGQAVLVPSQDMVLGFYYMTQLFSDRQLRSFATPKTLNYQISVSSNGPSSDQQTTITQSLDQKYQKDVYKHKYDARELTPVDRVFLNSIQLIKSFQTGQIFLHTPVWLMQNKKVENDEGAQLPLELRLDCFGGSTYIYPRHKVRKDEKSSRSNMYTLTTAGRVLVNQIVFS